MSHCLAHIMTNIDRYDECQAHLQSSLTNMSERSTQSAVLLPEMKIREWEIDELDDMLQSFCNDIYDPEQVLKQYLRQNMLAKQHGKSFMFMTCHSDDASQTLRNALEQKDVVVQPIDELKHLIAAYYLLEPDGMLLNTVDPVRLNLLSSIDQIKKRFVPMIVISEQDIKRCRMMSYSMGVHDFIPHTVDIDEQIIRISHQLERKKVFDQLVFTDELTEVYNRKYLEPAYNRVVNVFKHTHNSHLSMALIDFDHFKKINETYGHLMGDNVLKRLGTELKSGIQSTDELIRFGGEEFVVLFPHTHLGDASKRLENILHTFSNIIFSKGDQQFTCTFSAGVSEVNKSNLDLEHNIKIVDQLLAQAKKNGRNQIKAFVP